MTNIFKIGALMNAAARERQQQKLSRWRLQAAENMTAKDNLDRKIILVEAIEHESFDSDLNWGFHDTCETLYFQHVNATIIEWKLHLGLQDNLKKLPNVEEKIIRFRTRSRSQSPPYDGIWYGFLMDVKAHISQVQCPYNIKDVIQIGVTEEQRINCAMFIVIYAQIVQAHGENKTFRVNIFTCKPIK
jgi:hypothetical protein